MREAWRLVEAQVLARAALRALPPGVLLGVSAPLAGAPLAVAAVLALASGATALLERAAVVRALDAGRSLRRAALEASAASGIVVALALVQVVVVGAGSAGPDGQVEGVSRAVRALGSLHGVQLVELVLGLAAVAVSAGALSGALAIDRMDQRTSEFGGVWSLWLLDASLLLGLFAWSGATLASPSLEGRHLVASVGIAFVTALFAGVVLHLTMGVVYVLDRAADGLARLCGARPSAVEGPRAPPPEPPQA